MTLVTREMLASISFYVQTLQGKLVTTKLYVWASTSLHYKSPLLVYETNRIYTD